MSEKSWNEKMVDLIERIVAIRATHGEPGKKLKDEFKKLLKERPKDQVKDKEENAKS